MSISGRDWKSLFLGLLELALLLTAAFSIATSFDQWHRLLELFSHFRAQYLAVAMLLTAAFAWLRWRGYAAIGVATIALNAWYVVPWYLPAQAPAPGTGELSILHANVLKSNTDTTGLLAFIAATSPDVIIMQEVTPDWIAALAGLEDSHPYSIVEARGDAFGIALYSRFPVASSAVNSGQPLNNPEIVATLVAGERQLQLISAHTMPPLGRTEFDARNLQLDGIGKLAARTPHPLVLVGDLNISMWANHYRKLEQESGLANARAGFGIKPTWPRFFPPGLIPIDHVLVSADLAVADFEVGPDIGSDHYPVLARLTFRD